MLIHILLRFFCYFSIRTLWVWNYFRLCCNLMIFVLIFGCYWSVLDSDCLVDFRVLVNLFFFIHFLLKGHLCYFHSLLFFFLFIIHTLIWKYSSLLAIFSAFRFIVRGSWTLHYFSYECWNFLINFPWVFFLNHHIPR